MTESGLLVGAGAAAGIAIATLAVPFLAKLVPPSLPIAQTPSVDIRVLAFGVVVAFATGLAFGAAPIVRATRDSLLAGLNEGARAGGGAKEGARSALVGAEVMASVVLLASAGLLLRALWTVQRIDPGFRAQGVLTLRTALPMPQYGNVTFRDAFYRQVLSAVRALPGVADAAYMSFAPMTFRGGIWPVSLSGQPVAATVNQSGVLRYATPHLFSTLGIPIVRGRDLTPSDDRAHPFVAVVSQSFVRRFFPDRNPIGEHFTFAFAEREIVGVVGDIRARGLERQSEPQIYLSNTQVDDNSITFYVPKDLIVRSATTGLDPVALVPAIRAAIRRVDPALPVSDVRPLTDILDGETVSRAVQLRVIATFSAIALLLAAVGIHSVLAFAVAQRTQEIGVRIALGARAADILSMVLNRSLVLAAAGAIPGIVIAYGVGRWMKALLAGVDPADMTTFGSVVGLAVAMTIAGSLFPAIRALRVDAITAIRTE
jgi:predicted permease